MVVISVFILSGCVGGPPATPAPEVTEPPVETTPPPTTTPPPKTTPPPTTPPPTEPPTTPPPTTPPPTEPPSKYALMTTSATEVIPEGASKVQPLTDMDYFALPLPLNIGTMVEGIRAEYKVPTGKIYVLKFKSADTAADFFNAIIDKAEWRGTPYTERIINIGDKTLKVYHRIEFKDYFGTFMIRGLFIYYVTMTADEFSAEQYIKANMDFLFDGEPEPKPIPLVTKDVDLFSVSTPLRDVVPEGASIEVIPNSEYLYTIKYPNKPAGYAGDIRATYTTPEGRIYVSRFESVADAEAFLNSVLEKYRRTGSLVIEKTLTRAGKSLKIYHKMDGSYQATLILKGVFLYYVAVSSDEFDAEYYISRKLGYLYQ
jgi:hypothetical protein